MSNVFEQNATFAEAVKWYEDSGIKSSFLDDVIGKARTFNKATDKQIDAVINTVERMKEEALKPRADLVAGKRAVEGTIIGVKAKDGYYGVEFKMLVEEPEGAKVWGTIPKAVLMSVPSMEDLKGRYITFNATVEVSGSDPKFGFFKRPSKPNLLPLVESEFDGEAEEDNDDCPWED